jgi:hypothetical protein
MLMVWIGHEGTTKKKAQSMNRDGMNIKHQEAEPELDQIAKSATRTLYVNREVSIETSGRLCEVSIETSGRLCEVSIETRTRLPLYVRRTFGSNQAGLWVSIVRHLHPNDFYLFFVGFVFLHTMSINDLPVEVLVRVGKHLDLKGYRSMTKSVRRFGRATLDPYFNELFRKLFTMKTIGVDGKTRWYLNGKLHREDGPAVEYAEGTKVWYQNGLLHREDGPAFEIPDGTKIWYREGKRHREGGPAIEKVTNSVTSNVIN